MPKNKRSKNPQTTKNRIYKKKIYSLCNRASRGDSSANVELDAELKKHPLAKWAVKHWMKVRKIPSPSKNKQKEKPLSPEEQAQRDRFQRMGFDEGASVPSSNIKKIDK